MQKMNLYQTAPLPGGDQTILLYEAVGKKAAVIEEQLSVAKTVMQPGAAVTRHHHAYSKEIYIIMSGSAQMVVGNEVFETCAGDVILIMPPEIHTVVTQETGIEFLAITLPAYSAEDFIVDP